MSLQSGSLGRLWFGPQTAKGTAATTYYGFRANVGDVAPGQLFRNVGNLVGGSFLPGGSIKTAAFGAGGITLPPPLENYLGWLLYAFAGTVTSNTLSDSVSYYEHYFPSGADSTAPGKYLTARRTIPGGSAQYEQMEDLVPSRILLGITPGEYVTMRFDAMGRTISAPDGSGWTFTSEDETSVPIACRGGLEMPDGSSLSTATGAALEIINVLPPMNQVLVVGSYYPYDFPVLTRAITLSYTHLYETNTLYTNFYWNGTAWQPTIYSTSLDVYVQSTGYMTGTSATPYEFKLWANNVDWACDPITLAGGQLIGMRITGSVAKASSGFDWYMRLRNLTASYTWPT